MSLLHLSISASEPERVASFLATVLGGEAMLFPPFPGCWIAFAAQNDGTAIEVYPDTHVLVAGENQIECIEQKRDTAETFVHAASPRPCPSMRSWRSGSRKTGKAECATEARFGA